MNRVISLFRQPLLTLTLVLGLPAGYALAGPSADPTTEPAASPLSVALNPDGTLRAGVRGSFNAAGYCLGTGPNGRPAFRPTAPRRVAGIGDNNWSDAFGVNGATGPVYALVADGSGNLYVGGNFRGAGDAVANGIAKWNGSTWAAVGGSLDGTTGQVNALVLDGSGNLYAGGGFTSVGGVNVHGVARWNGFGWADVGGGVRFGTDEGSVQALAFDTNGNLYAGGSFTAAGGVATGCIARWDGSSWTGLGTGLTYAGNVPKVSSLAAGSGGTLYVGGAFTTAGGLTVRNVAKWNGAAWSAFGTNPVPGVSGTVRAIAVMGTSVIVGGDLVNSVGSSYNMARWTGSAWTTLNAYTPTVYTLCPDGAGNLYVGGFSSQHFSVTGTTTGQASGTVAKLSASLNWTSVNTGNSGSVYALATSASGLYAGGVLNLMGGTTVTNVAAYPFSQNIWSRLGTLSPAGGGLNGIDGFGTGAAVIAVDGNGRVYAGGTLVKAGDTPVSNIALWDGTAWGTLGTGLDGTVRALALDGTGNLYAGGSFTTADGSVANRVAKWNGTTWTALGSGMDGSVGALAFDGSGNLYAGGDFTTAGGVAARRVAKWDGTAWSSLSTAAFNNSVNALALDGAGNLYAGGDFVYVGSTQVNGIAKWDGTAWTALGTGLSLGGYAKALALDAVGNLYVGGSFSSAGGTAAPGLAKWDGATWSSVGGGTNGSVMSVAVDGTGGVYAGGYFTTAGSVAVSNVAYWNGTIWSNLGTGLNGGVSTLALDGGSGLYASGGFTAVGDGSKIMVNMGRYALAAPLPTLTSISPLSSPVGSLLTFTGTNLTPTVITFAGTNNNTVTSGFSVNPAHTQITNVAVPAGAATGNVTVTTPDGTSNGVLFTVTAPQLAVRQGSTSYPSGGAAYGFGNQVVNTSSSAVAFTLSNPGTAPLSISSTTTTGNFATSGTLPTSVAAGSTGTVGVVFTPTATGPRTGTLVITSNAGTYTVNLSGTGTVAAPVLTSLSPTSGPVGTSVTLTGITLASATSVSFNGTTVSSGSFASNSATSLVLNVPAGAATGNVTVTTAGGTSNGVMFTVSTPPAIGSFSPGSGTIGSTMLINGANYSRAAATSSGGSNTAARTSATVTAVQFNGVAAAFTIVSATQLSAIVPTGATTGPITVTNSDGTATSAANFAVLPTLGSISPTSGLTGSTVVLNGTGLTGTTTITFSGASSNTVTSGFAVNAAGTQITGIVVPSGATTGSVTATTPSGTSNGVTFTATPPADLTISTGTVASPVAVAAGSYNSITVTSSGVAQLAGGTVVNSSVSVSGTLLTNCQPLTGPASFTLVAGATLGICDAAGISTTPGQGAVQTTGPRSLSADANYLYNGTTAQSTGTGPPSQVRNLTTTNPSTLTLTRPTRVRQVLTVAGAGNLVLNGQPLTLLSDASGTALVVNSGTGVVTGGTATVQRYLTTSNLGRGYRHYSSPVSGNVLTDVATATFTPLFSTAYNTSATPGTITPFPNVFGYDQLRQDLNPSNFSSFDKGWYSPCTGAGNVPDNFLAGRGYAVNLPGTELVDFVGTLRTGDLTLPLVRNFLPTTAEAGWHLLGNPYPAPIDWSAIAIADRPGLDASMYVFESSGSYTGQYRSYVNSIGNTSPLIGSSQGFFVRVSQGQTSGSLTFRNGQRLTSYGTQVAVRRGPADTRPQLRLMLTGNSTGTSDDFYLYAQTGATPGADAEFDAVKLANPSGLNLASLTATGEALAIDGRADFGTAAALRIPLQVSVPAAGSYILTAAAVAHLPLGTTATLVDNLTGTRTALTAGASYRFATTTATAPGRFWLNLAPAGAPLSAASAALEAQVLTFPNPTTGRLTVLRPAGAAASAVLLNALGQVVKTVALPTAETALDLRGLASGVYTLRLTLTGQPVSKRVVLE